MIDRIERIKCTGCKMCGDICPNQAIDYQSDKKGFWYPKVDYKKCTRCSLCTKYCPGLAPFKNEKSNPAVYAAWVTNDEKRRQSTSGGAYYAFAKQYISEGKYVVGCQYTKDCKGAFHSICNSDAGMEKLIGSKYFQSDTGGIYKEIKHLLDAGKEVLFCGTPCQSSALQNYLKKQCTNLTTIDFICKGINSPLVYSAYVSELEKRFHSQVESVRMKDKRAGWESLAISIQFRNGCEYFRKGKDDLWVRGYVQGSLYTRPSCFHCRYRTLPRVSDISLGDFWGVQGVSKEDLFKGISLIMVNSDKGKSLFNRIKKELYFEERSFHDAMKGNHSLFINESKERDSELFFERLDLVCVSKSIKKSLRYKRDRLTVQSLYHFFRR